MRWKRSELGDTREKNIFLWFPLNGDDGFTYWLETVHVEYVLVDRYGGPCWCRNRITGSTGSVIKYIGWAYKIKSPTTGCGTGGENPPYVKSCVVNPPKRP